MHKTNNAFVQTPKPDASNCHLNKCIYKCNTCLGKLANFKLLYKVLQTHIPGFPSFFHIYCCNPEVTFKKKHFYEEKKTEPELETKTLNKIKEINY